MTYTSERLIVVRVTPKRTREIPVYVGVFMNYDDEERWMIYRKDGRNFPGSKPYLVMDPWDPEVETPQI